MEWISMVGTAHRGTILTSMTLNMIGFTKVVIPTPMAHPVMPNPLPWARRSLGKISVGTRKATVPQVAAYLVKVSGEIASNLRPPTPS